MRDPGGRLMGQYGASGLLDELGQPVAAQRGEPGPQRIGPVDRARHRRPGGLPEPCGAGLAVAHPRPEHHVQVHAVELVPAGQFGELSEHERPVPGVVQAADGEPSRVGPARHADLPALARRVHDPRGRMRRPVRVHVAGAVVDDPVEPAPDRPGQQPRQDVRRAGRTMPRTGVSGPEREPVMAIGWHGHRGHLSLADQVEEMLGVEAPQEGLVPVRDVHVEQEAPVTALDWSGRPPHGPGQPLTAPATNPRSKYRCRVT